MIYDYELRLELDLYVFCGRIFPNGNVVVLAMMLDKTIQAKLIVAYQSIAYKRPDKLLMLIIGIERTGAVQAGVVKYS